MTDAKTFFDAIGKTETFHSRTLAWFLETDHVFLESFLKAFVPPNFLKENKILEMLSRNIYPSVTSEYLIGDSGKSGERIDIMLTFDSALIGSALIGSALIGIEVKTVDYSANEDQLLRYWNLFKPNENQRNYYLIYLTPFNDANLPESILPNKFLAIKAFKQFDKVNLKCGLHINWEQVAALYPTHGSNDFLSAIYTQHRIYIKEKICDKKKHMIMRKLAIFLGEETVQKFFDYLNDRQIFLAERPNYYVIPLKENSRKITEIVEAISILLNSKELGLTKQKGDKLDPSLRLKYENGTYGRFFQQLFRVIETKPYTWLKGIGELGLRAAHTDCPSGFSVCTLAPEEIKIRMGR